jgi:RHS repeat-associated protein
MEYTWDANGNLLDDGVSTYTYDHANRLTSVIQGGDTYTFAYNGLGDRLQQTVNGIPTNYTLDINAPLVQTLSDGTNTYLYGLSRIAQHNIDAEYFIRDAVGSVRQLTNSISDVVLERVYEPFGTIIRSVGIQNTDYAFTDQQIDPTGLIYLRARYLDTARGQFISRDPWRGSLTNPQTLNRWVYVQNRPITLTDPSGYISEDEDEVEDALAIIDQLKRDYQVNVIVDFGWRLAPILYPGPSERLSCAEWEQGAWRSIDELLIVLEVARRFEEKTGSAEAARRAIGGVTINRISQGTTRQLWTTVYLADYIFDQAGGDLKRQWGPRVAIAHELAHYWDWRSGGLLARIFNLPGSLARNMAAAVEGEVGPTQYARTAGISEDWAESVAGYLFPEYFEFLVAEAERTGDYSEFRLIVLPSNEIAILPPGLGPLRQVYVETQFANLSSGSP